MTGDLILGDNVKVEIGSASGGDLQIYHDTNHSYIEEAGYGALKLKGDDIRFEDSSGNNIIKSDGSAALLYYDGSQKLATNSGGVSVTGNITTSATLSSFTDRIKIINGSDQLNIGQWDTANHRIEADANRPLSIQSYHTSGGIKLGASGTTKLQVLPAGVTVTGTLGVTGHTSLSTVIIDGLSNYTGLEVKGAGAARPQVKFTNVNQGVLGSIYGTEGNALVISTGTAGATAITIDSSQRVGIGSGTPSYTLDVDGDINFTGTLREDGTEFSGGISTGKAIAMAIVFG